MNVPLNYIIIPLIAVVTSIVGRYFSGSNMQWYHTSLQLPSFTPPDWVFGIAWQLIFFTTTAAGLLVWNTFEKTGTFWCIMLLFILSAVLNVLWTYLFFHKHFLGISVLETVFLLITVYSLFALIFQHSFLISLLIIPYAGWLTFAFFLNYSVWFLNSK